LVKFRRRGEKIAQLHLTKPRLQPKLLHEANTRLLPYCHIRAEQRSSLKVDRLQSSSESLVHLMALALVLVLVLVLAPNQVLVHPLHFYGSVCCKLYQPRARYNLRGENSSHLH